jgi:hypothetical protein
METVNRKISKIFQTDIHVVLKAKKRKIQNQASKYESFPAYQKSFFVAYFYGS